MDDLQASQWLATVLSPEVPRVLLARWLATALALSQYGTVAFLDDPLEVDETWNWLGEVWPLDSDAFGHVLDLPVGERIWPILEPQEGLARFVHVLHSFGQEVWMSGDAGWVAWVLLQAGLGNLPGLGKSPTLDDWRILRESLELAGERLQETLGAPVSWDVQDFSPPVEQVVLDRRWSHEEAALALDHVLVPEATARMRVGLLAWARLASSYGYVSGQQTYNWAMTGQSFSGKAPPEGHVQYEGSPYAVEVYDDPHEGIGAFVKRFAPAVERSKGDTAQLAHRMLREGAFGVKVPETREKWLELTARLRKQINEIESATGLRGDWGEHEIPEEYKQVDAKPEDVNLPWGKVLLGAVVLIGGGGMLVKSYLDRKKEKEAAAAKGSLPSPDEVAARQPRYAVSG